MAATDPRLPQARTDNLLLRELPGGELMAYDTLRHQAHTLNRSAAVVWRHCDGQSEVSLVAGRLQHCLVGGAGRGPLRASERQTGCYRGDRGATRGCRRGCATCVWPNLWERSIRPTDTPSRARVNRSPPQRSTRQRRCCTSASRSSNTAIRSSITPPCYVAFETRHHFFFSAILFALCRLVTRGYCRGVPAVFGSTVAYTE
jgi:hypothetical protein